MLSLSNRQPRRTTLNVEPLEDRLALSTIPQALPMYQPPVNHQAASSITLQFGNLPGNLGHTAGKFPIQSFSLGTPDGKNQAPPVTIDIPDLHGKFAQHLTTGTKVGKVFITIAPANGNNYLRFTLRGASVSSSHSSVPGSGIATDIVTLSANSILEQAFTKDGRPGANVPPSSAAWDKAPNVIV